MIRAISVYCIVVGFAMATVWVAELRRGAWHRGDRSHAELTLHLSAELITAAWLIGGAAALLAFGRSATPAVAVALGMLLYTTVVSPGYFIARRELRPVGMFAVLMLLTTAVLAVLLSGV